MPRRPFFVEFLAAGKVVALALARHRRSQGYWRDCLGSSRLP